jgi:hypothetical protein
MKKTKQIEFIIAGLFLIAIFLFILVFLSLANKSPTINYSSNQVIIQTINYPSKITKCEVIKVPYEVYEKIPNYTKKNVVLSKKLSYEDSSNSHIQETIFGGEIQVYEVNLENTGCKGGYFTVVFYFKTLCGKKKKKLILFIKT